MAITTVKTDRFYQKYGNDIVKFILTGLAENVKMQDGSTVEATLTAVKNSLSTFLTGADNEDNVIDRLSELVTAISENKENIDQILEGKLTSSDIVNDLTTGGTNKALSAEQGKALKALIDGIHTFANQTVLDALNEDSDGELTYNGVKVNKVYAGSVNIDDTDPAFGAAIDALGLADGALITVVPVDESGSN